MWPPSSRGNLTSYCPAATHSIRRKDGFDSLYWGFLCETRFINHLQCLLTSSELEPIGHDEINLKQQQLVKADRNGARHLR